MVTARLKSFKPKPDCFASSKRILLSRLLSFNRNLETLQKKNRSLCKLSCLARYIAGAHAQCQCQVEHDGNFSLSKVVRLIKLYVYAYVFSCTASLHGNKYCCPLQFDDAAVADIAYCPTSVQCFNNTADLISPLCCR